MALCHLSEQLATLLLDVVEAHGTVNSEDYELSFVWNEGQVSNQMTFDSNLVALVKCVCVPNVGHRSVVANRSEYSVHWFES